MDLLVAIIHHKDYGNINTTYKYIVEYILNYLELNVMPKTNQTPYRKIMHPDKNIR